MAYNESILIFSFRTLHRAPYLHPVMAHTWQHTRVSQGRSQAPEDDLPLALRSPERRISQAGLWLTGGCWALWPWAEKLASTTTRRMPSGSGVAFMDVQNHSQRTKRKMKRMIPCLLKSIATIFKEEGLIWESKLRKIEASKKFLPQWISCDNSLSQKKEPTQQGLSGTEGRAG